MINCWDGLSTVLHLQELRSCTSRTMGDWVFDRLNSDGTINKSGRNHKHVGLWPKMTHMGLTENWRFTMIYPLFNDNFHMGTIMITQWIFWYPILGQTHILSSSKPMLCRFISCEPKLLHASPIKPQNLLVAWHYWFSNFKNSCQAIVLIANHFWPYANINSEWPRWIAPTYWSKLVWVWVKSMGSLTVGSLRASFSLDH